MVLEPVLYFDRFTDTDIRLYCMIILHCILETYDQTFLSLLVLQLTRQFYNGTRRSPWNEIECGDYYTRAMSSFALNLTASGQVCI